MTERRAYQMVELFLTVWVHQLHHKLTCFPLHLLHPFPCVDAPSPQPQQRESNCLEKASDIPLHAAGSQLGEEVEVALGADLGLHAAVAVGYERACGWHIHASISNTPIQKMKVFF